MVFRFSLSVLVGLMVLTSGCSLIPDRTLVYQEADTFPRMNLPEDAVFMGEQDLYVIPDVDDRVRYTGERFVIPKPPQLAILGRAVGGREVDSAEAAHDTGSQDGEDLTQDPTRTRIIYTKDGNGYPIVMMATQFPWAWEHIGAALQRTDLKIEDRNRQSGIYIIRVPTRYGLGDNEAQIKLSHTVNGIQVAVLNRRGTSLVDKVPGEAILQRLYEQL